MALLLKDWSFVGRPAQQEPEGKWTYWMMRTGRGWGKTLTGAQWTKRKALEDEPGCRIALVAPTLADVRKTMIEGETGILNTLPISALVGQSREEAYNRSSGEVRLSNGSTYFTYSSEVPNRLRGPQHHYCWCDELSSFNDAHRGDELETTWSNIKLGTRLGKTPRIVITTTPKANKLTKALSEIPYPRLRLIVGSSYENQDNLSEEWWDEVITPYEGTRIGSQEIHAIVLDDIEGALWRQQQLDDLRVLEAPSLTRIVVAVDPNTTSGEAANDAGIIVAGLGHSDRKGYVLADRTQTRGGPAAWAQAAVDAYHDYEADRIVVEVNNGGEMCKLVIRSVDPGVPVKMVSASRGKRTRAEPVSALYESNEEHEREARVHHVGPFVELEREMTSWTPESESPNRMDALVWALTELMLGRRESPARVLATRRTIPTESDKLAQREFEGY